MSATSTRARHLSRRQARLLRRGVLLIAPALAMTAMSGCASSRLCGTSGPVPTLRLTVPPAPEPRMVQICLNGICTQNIADTNARTIKHTFTPAYAGEGLDISVTIEPPGSTSLRYTTTGTWIGQNTTPGDVCTQALHLNLVVDDSGKLTALPTF